jgi:hypothetical protein
MVLKLLIENSVRPVSRPHLFPRIKYECVYVKYSLAFAYNEMRACIGVEAKAAPTRAKYTAEAG